MFTYAIRACFTSKTHHLKNTRKSTKPKTHLRTLDEQLAQLAQNVAILLVHERDRLARALAQVLALATQDIADRAMASGATGPAVGDAIRKARIDALREFG